MCIFLVVKEVEQLLRCIVFCEFPVRFICSDVTGESEAGLWSELGAVRKRERVCDWVPALLYGEGQTGARVRL